MFHVGQKVVCVDDDPGPDRIEGVRDGTIYVLTGDLDGLTEGVVYTIRDIVEYPFDGQLMLYLCEIDRPPLLGPSGLFETGFALRRFRPAIERKTDISIFTEILKPKHVKEPA